MSSTAVSLLTHLIQIQTHAVGHPIPTVFITYPWTDCSGSQAAKNKWVASNINNWDEVQNGIHIAPLHCIFTLTKYSQRFNTIYSLMVLSLKISALAYHNTCPCVSVYSSGSPIAVKPRWVGLWRSRLHSASRYAQGICVATLEWKKERSVTLGSSAWMMTPAVQPAASWKRACSAGMLWGKADSCQIFERNE